MSSNRSVLVRLRVYDRDNNKEHESTVVLIEDDGLELAVEGEVKFRVDIMAIRGV